ncbi:sigma-70 family RNA polymerase sigma factor [Pararobbsia silviterrae]|uniref:Sigma-70 family RNA polymerase sigma factor n=1 Tax=Pararobbsia silviterrae TaxID=1792498 RepID=A0A494XYY7_9BURK|nr:sigma-70 family RNA polymerase sigma factor [Pararobbsia silviterrae]RKP55774.1 sigma-70 family RNA polymerase sigma factor [Pararobbsia silviterrae]
MTDSSIDRRAPARLDGSDAFDRERGRLVSIAYRMLGSRAEAEDIVQDAWLKWQASDRAAFLQPVAWLTTVVTRLSIDRLRALRTEHAAREKGVLPEPWLDPVVPSAEDRVLDGAQLSYGLMLLLDRLSPDARAAFLLREGFDCDYETIGAALGKPADHCRQLIHRAKARLARAGAPLKPNDFDRQRTVVEHLRAAIDAQDATALLAVLDGARVVADAPEPIGVSAVARILAANARVAASGTETVSSIAHARPAFIAETVSFGVEAGVALVLHGEITALCVPWFDRDDALTLYVVSRPSSLARANRMLGHAAIARLIARIALNAPSARNVCGAEIALA